MCLSGCNLKSSSISRPEKRTYLLQSVCSLILGISSPLLHAASLTQLSEESLESLLKQEVTSVSRKEQNLYTAPAAVHVITADDLQRRGVKSLPEALSLAPGVIVAAIDGNKWAVSSRGFSGIYSNKLLVQIDGRTIYTPTFSGVYWEQHDLPINEIKRIEVVRGSGATLWGANAVNGIINIITKHSGDTQGGAINASLGDSDTGSVGVRYGGQIDQQMTYRLNIMTSESAANTRFDGAGDSHDAAQSERFHIRLDSMETDESSWSLTAGYQDVEKQQMLSVLNLPAPTFFQTDVADTLESTSWYLNGSWTQYHQGGAESQFRIFIDNYDRSEIHLSQDVTTYDFDYQLSLAPINDHSIVTGVGYRVIDADYRNSTSTSIHPAEQDISLFSMFIQDEITLSPDKLALTLGSKFEHNDFTGWEVQPNVRLAYTPATGHFAWASISKAVRTPSIAERGSTIQGGITFPFTTWVQGNSDQVSEEVLSYELGYRFFGDNYYTLDAALFYQEYDDYLSFEQVGLNVFEMGNKLSGRSYGFELAAVWQATPDWQITANYSYLDVNMKKDADSADPFSVDVLNGSYAKNMFKLHSALDISPSWSFDAWVLYTDKISVPSNFALFQGGSVDEVLSTNMRLGWQPEKNVEVALTALNLFDGEHLEYIGESFAKPTEIDRSIILSLTWEF